MSLSEPCYMRHLNTIVWRLDVNRAQQDMASLASEAETGWVIPVAAVENCNWYPSGRYSSKLVGVRYPLEYEIVSLSRGSASVLKLPLPEYRLHSLRCLSVNCGDSEQTKVPPILISSSAKSSGGNP